MELFFSNNKQIRHLYHFSKKIAKIVSALFEPFSVGAFTLLLVLLKVDGTPSQKTLWLMVAFVVGITPPLTVLVYEKKKGKITDWFMSKRAERRDVQIAWVAGAAVFTSLALIYQVPRLLQALSLTFFALSFVVTLISFYWKISVHTAMISLAVLVLILTYSSSLAFLVVLIFLVAWARIRLGAHTLSQVSAAALITIAITYFWFSHFGLATF